MIEKIAVTNKIFKKSQRNQFFKIVDSSKKKTSEIIQEAKELFNFVTKYSNETLDRDFPAPKKTMTGYFSKKIQYDTKNPEVQSCQKNEIEKTQGIFISLRQRILMDMVYFKETGNLLETKSNVFIAKSKGEIVILYYYNSQNLFAKYRGNEGKFYPY